MDHEPWESLKLTGDYFFAGVTVAALFDWAPRAAALASFVYALIRIYETRTVQRFLGRDS